MGLIETLWDIIKSWIEPMNYETMFNTVVQVMSFQDSSSSIGGGTEATVLSDATILEALINITGPLAMVMMVLYFLVSLFTNATQEREPDMQIFVRTGIFLIVADVLLMNSPQIIGTFMGMSNALLNQMNHAMGALGEQITFPVIDGLPSFIAVLVLFVVSLIGKLVSLVGSLIVFVVCVSAKIELMLRLAYVPIGFASVAGQSRDGSLRYLKKLFASMFYCGSIVVAMFIACSISTSLLTTVPPADSNIFSIAIRYVMASFYTMVMPLAAAGVVSTAKAVINEAFGV